MTRLCKVVILRSPTVQKWFDWWTKTPSRKMLKWLWNWLKRETCPWVAVPPPVCEIAMLRSKSGPMEGKGSFVHLHLQKPVQFPGSCFLHSSKVSNESLHLVSFELLDLIAFNQLGYLRNCSSTSTLISPLPKPQKLQFLQPPQSAWAWIWVSRWHRPQCDSRNLPGQWSLRGKISGCDFSDFTLK